MRSIPGMTVICPADDVEAKAAVRFKQILIDELKKLLNTKLIIRPTTILVPATSKLQHSIEIFPCFKYRFFIVSYIINMN